MRNPQWLGITQHGINLRWQVFGGRCQDRRHVGGQPATGDTNQRQRMAARIIETVRANVEGRRGPERVLTAIEVAVAEIRSDPAGQLFLDSARGGRGWNWLTASPAVADFATELTGLADDDARAAQWIVRLVLSLLFWPDADPHGEHLMLQRFVAPAFAEGGGSQSWWFGQETSTYAVTNCPGPGTESPGVLTFSTVHTDNGSVL